MQEFPHYSGLPEKKQLPSLEAIISTGIKNKDFKIVFKGNYLKGAYYLRIKEYRKAKKHFQIAQTCALVCKKISYEAWTNERLALIYSKEGIIDSAVTHYLQAMTLFEKFDTYNYAHTINNLGETYFKLGAYKTALNYFSHALALKKKNENWESSWAYAYWNMAEVYYELHQIDSSWYYYELASKNAKKTRSISYYANEGFARINTDKRNYTQALKELTAIKTWYFETKNPHWIADMGLLFMEIYLAKKDEKSFHYWSDIVKNSIHQEYIPDQKRRFYHLMASHFRTVNDMDSTIYYQDEELKAWEENYNKNGLSSINQLAQSQEQMLVANNLLRSQQELQSIKLDREKIASKNLKLSHRNSVLWIFIVVASIVVLLTGIFIWITLRLRIITTLANERLLEKEKRIRETQMLHPHPFAIVQNEGTLLNCNEAFIELFAINPNYQNHNLLKSLPSHLQTLFSRNTQTLLPYKKQTSLWIWESKGESFAVQFSILNLSEDPTVNGFILEGINQTVEYRQQKQKAQYVEQQLAEKEAELVDLSMETAISQLALESNRKVMSSLKTQLVNQQSFSQVNEIKQLLLLEKNQEKFWENYIVHYNRANKGLIDLLLEKHPMLTQNEIKHMIYADMQLSIKEVSQLVGVTEDSVKKARQRLKKKLQLEVDRTLKSYLNDLLKRN